MNGDFSDSRDRHLGPSGPSPNHDPQGGDRKRISSKARFRIVAPPEKGPVLETYYQGRSWYGGAFMLALAVFLFTVSSWSFEWMSSWGIWLALILISALFPLLGKTKIAAGAAWLQCGKAWVDLHDLQTINFSRTAHDGRSMELKDRSDRWLMVGMDDLCANKQLWELVHPALRVSMNKGAQFNSLARKELIPVLTALE